MVRAVAAVAGITGPVALVRIVVRAVPPVTVLPLCGLMRVQSASDHGHGGSGSGSREPLR